MGNMQALDAKLRQVIERTLLRVDDRDVRGPRLVDDAQRLIARSNHLLRLQLIPGEVDREALQLACYAMQLPLRQLKIVPAGKLGRTNLRDRAEQAAEMLATDLASAVSEELLERTARILHELPQRTPTPDEARLLADTINLDDFGMIGLLQQTISLARLGGGVAQVADGCEKRDLYGYWDARLKEGFHFEPVRAIARKRLEHARSAAALLLAELKEDQSTS